MPLEHIGRYEIQRRLGTGGMGSLYLARDPALDRLVAIKLLKDDYQDDEELRQRFLREARSVARLRHRNIVLVFDVGEHDGRQFMAMEYLSGQTLTKLLAQTPPLPLVQRVSLGEQLCAGLAHAHAAGIVHRDIKPANIMLEPDGVLKILDFGIAHLADSGITRDGMMMGSVNYMSPEQIGGHRVDHRTDVFAAGAVLYELVALRQAFPGGIDSGVLNRILHEGHTPITRILPGVNPTLSQIVDRALERNPDRRYQDVEALRRDLVQVRRQLPDGRDEHDHAFGETVVVPQRPSSPPAPPPSSPPSRGRREETDRRKDSSQRFVAIRRQQAEEQLNAARKAFDGADYEAALEAAERAAAIDPEFHEAFELLERTKGALEAGAVRASLDEAERLLAGGRLAEALPLIDRALETVNLQAAPDVPPRARKLADQARALRDRQLRIEAGLSRARTSIEERRFETALRAISELLTLDPGNAQARELQTKATAALSAQRDHDLRRQQAYERIDFARSLAAEHRLKDATATLAAIMPPTDTVRKAVAEVAAFIEEQKRAAAREATVANIRAQLDANAFEQVIAAIDAVPPDDRTGELRALRMKAENGLRARQQVERKRIELSRVVTTARELCGAGDFEGAREMIAEGFRLVGEDPAFNEVLEEITRAERAVEQKRQDDIRDRMAARKVEAARQMSRQDARGAVAFLEKDGSGHPSIAAALQELRAQAAREDVEARQQAERDRLQQEQAAREHAEHERALHEERARRERTDRERAQREQAAREQAAREQAREQAAREQAEHERAERARAEREQAAREEAERARQAEAARAREEAERKERERREREHQQQRLTAEAEARRREELARQEREEQARQREAQRLEAQRQAEAEARRQEEFQNELGAASETIVLRDRGTQPPTLADVDVMSPAETIVSRPTRPPAPAPVPQPARKTNVAVLGGIAALIVAGVVGVWLLRRGAPEEPGTQGSIATSVPTILTTAPTTVPPTPPETPRGPETEIAGLVQSARALLKQGNIAGAAQALRDSFARTPVAPEVQGVAQEVFQTAAAQAQQAKTEADRANGASSPAYQDAMTRLKSADAMRSARRITQAVDEYAAAARLFVDAARPTVVARGSTITPTIPPTILSVPPTTPQTVAPTVQSTIATTSIAPTSIVPTIDLATVQNVLTAYGSASRNFNVAAIEQVFPGLPQNIRVRIEALRKNYSYCDYMFTNVRIVSSTATEATIRTETVESCKPRTAQGAKPSTSSQQFGLRKTPSGTWTIFEALGQ